MTPAELTYWRSYADLQRSHQVSICALHLAQANANNYKIAWQSFTLGEREHYTKLAEQFTPRVTDETAEQHRQGFLVRMGGLI